jgi:transcriptional regulator with XRE-family HTH domain
METLRELRTQNHLTQKALADLSGDHITRHAVLRMEQHVYPVPLPAVIKGLSEITGYAPSDLEQQYLKEVHMNRQVNGQLWGLPRVRLSDLFVMDAGNMHPFRAFRMEIAHKANVRDSAIQFCMAFSIHPFTLAEYENYNTQYPEQIALALTEAGLRDSITDIINSDERFNRVL